METLPITARSFEKDYHINGDNFERSYKETISDFKTWEDAGHAEDWVIIPGNMGPHLSIDETCLSTGEVYTILSNKEAHGRKGCLVAISHYKGDEGEGGHRRLEKAAGSRPSTGGGGNTGLL